MDQEIEVSPIAPAAPVDDGDTIYPDCQSVAEQRRAWIVEKMGSPEFDGRAQVRNFRIVEHYLKTGEELPQEPMPSVKGNIKSVK